MIVCICNAVSERDIDEAVADGAHNLESLQSLLPVANQCGSCRCCAEACVESAHDRQQRLRREQPTLISLMPQSPALLAAS